MAKKRFVSVLLTVGVLLSIFVMLPTDLQAVTTSAIVGVTTDEGSGTHQDPYLIDTAEELQGMNLNLSAYYRLKTDIVVNTGNASDWKTNPPESMFTPIGANDDAKHFVGHFDGDGHTVSGVYVKQTTGADYGLFSTLGDGAEVGNFALVNSYIYSEGGWCGVIGQTKATVNSEDNEIHIYNIYSDAIIDNNASSEAVAGILGGCGNVSQTPQAKIFVDSCVSASTGIQGRHYIGGIVGNGNNADLTVTNCLFSGSVMSSSNYVCGIVGRDDSANCTIENCVVTGTVICTNAGNAYAFVNSNYPYRAPTVTNCYYTSFLDAARNAILTDVELVNVSQLSGKDAEITVDAQTWTKRYGDVPIPTGCLPFMALVDERLVLLGGASVRINAPTGLRFSGKIDKAYFDSLENAEVGILILPRENVEGREFTQKALDLSDTLYLKIPAVLFANAKTAATDGYYLFNCAIVNLFEENHSRDFAARAYLKVGNSVYYSLFDENENARSAAEVSTRALLDISETSQREYIHTIEDGDILSSQVGKYSPYGATERAVMAGFVQNSTQPNTQNLKNYFSTDGKLYREYTVGEDTYDIDCFAYEFKNTTLAEYYTMIDRLCIGGMTVHASNGDSGIDGACYQTTLTNEIYTVNVTHYVKTGEIFATIEEYRAVSPLQIKPATQVTADGTKLHNPKHPTVDGNYKFGELDIFELSNHHFVIVDGAQEYSAEMTVEYLENLVPQGEIPIVDAWFLTHAHPDHIYCLWGIGRDADLVSRVIVNGFYYTFPNDEGARRENDYSGLCTQIANFNSVIGNFKDENGNTTPFYKLHAGMRFYIDELEVQVLMTQDQLMPSEYQNGFNDSSTSYRMMVHGEEGDTTFLMLGDAYIPVCDKLTGKYEQASLHTDYFFSLHHGNNDYKSFFQYIQPRNIIYTAPSLNPKNKTGYAWLNENTEGQYCAPCMIAIS